MRLGNARVKLTKRFSVHHLQNRKILKLRFAAVCLRAVYEVDRYFLAGLFVLFLKAQSLKLLAAHTFVIGHRFGRPAHSINRININLATPAPLQIYFNDTATGVKFSLILRQI